MLHAGAGIQFRQLGKSHDFPQLDQHQQPAPCSPFGKTSCHHCHVSCSFTKATVSHGKTLPLPSSSKFSVQSCAEKLGTTPLGQAKFAAKIGSLHRPSSGCIPSSFRNQGESAAHGISKNEVSPEQHAK